VRAPLSGCLAVLVSVTAACEPSGARESFVVRDSAGIEIVESRAPAWAAGGGWSVDSVASFVAASDSLFEVGDARLRSDGKLLVVNAGSAEILVFDSAQHLEAAWGGRGEGPGEFSALADVADCAGDTIIARDLARLTVLGPHGEFSRTIPVEGRLTPSRAFELIGASDDCSAILLALRRGRQPESGEVVFRYPTEVFWAQLDSGSAVPIGSFPGSEVLAVEVVGRRVGARFVFGVEPQWTTDGDKTFYGPADRFEVQVFSAAGELERILRWGAEREPIGENDWKRYEEWRAAQAALEPEVAPTIPTRASHPAQAKPAYSKLLVDDEGNLWVMAYSSSLMEDFTRAESARWSVLDPEGRWQGEVTLPPRFELTSVAHGHVVGIKRDELDVPTVQALAIRKGLAR
jgi:hypothetical protein